MENPSKFGQHKGKHGGRAEEKVAKRLGGQTSFASGALDFQKGDIRLEKFLIEVKSTIKRSIPLKLDWLLKVTGESSHTDREPALNIQFVDERGDAIRNGSWVLVREVTFQEMIDEISEKQTN